MWTGVASKKITTGRTRNLLFCARPVSFFLLRQIRLSYADIFYSLLHNTARRFGKTWSVGVSTTVCNATVVSHALANLKYLNISVTAFHSSLLLRHSRLGAEHLLDGQACEQQSKFNLVVQYFRLHALTLLLSISTLDAGTYQRIRQSGSSPRGDPQVQRRGKPFCFLLGFESLFFSRNTIHIHIPQILVIQRAGWGGRKSIVNSYPAASKSKCFLARLCSQPYYHCSPPFSFSLSHCTTALRGSGGDILFLEE